ncbi:hypothetical protein LTR02_017849 [Friedmanniomyces endolithicus]|nr:hypothetical protein LTR02_017849 [Friedmanniomyces endolithicus]
MTKERRHEVVSGLQKEILVHTSTNLSLSSLQAALIVAIVDYGAGNLHAFWNGIAVCKRVGTHLGLLDLVSNNGDNYNKISSVPPRMLALPHTVIEQEERIRAFWMTEVLDNVSTLGTGWNLSVSPVESHALLPCNEIVWAFPERTVDGSSPLNLECSSLLSLYVTLVTRSLAKVHESLRQEFDHSSLAHQTQQQERCMALDTSLEEWRQSKEVVETLSSHSPTHDPLYVLINATLHM